MTVFLFVLFIFFPRMLIEFIVLLLRWALCHGHTLLSWCVHIFLLVFVTSFTFTVLSQNPWKSRVTCHRKLLILLRSIPTIMTMGAHFLSTRHQTGHSTLLLHSPSRQVSTTSPGKPTLSSAHSTLPPFSMSFSCTLKQWDVH